MPFYQAYHQPHSELGVKTSPCFDIKHPHVMHQNIPMFYPKTWGCFYSYPTAFNEQGIALLIVKHNHLPYSVRREKKELTPHISIFYSNFVFSKQQNI